MMSLAPPLLLAISQPLLGMLKPRIVPLRNSLT